MFWNARKDTKPDKTPLVNVLTIENTKSEKKKLLQFHVMGVFKEAHAQSSNNTEEAYLTSRSEGILAPEWPYKAGLNTLGLISHLWTDSEEKDKLLGHYIWRFPV